MSNLSPAKTWGLILVSIPFLLFIIVMIKPFKKSLFQLSPSEFQPSIRFLKNNLWLFITVNILLLLYYVYLLFFPLKIFERQFIGNYLLIFLGWYWIILINSLVIGFVLIFFKESAGGRKIEKYLLLTSSLKFFKPLFCFYLIFSVLTCYNLFSSQLLLYIYS